MSAGFLGLTLPSGRIFCPNIRKTNSDIVDALLFHGLIAQIGAFDLLHKLRHMILF
jgi:hypothetical protein